ncbi:MAG: hypothetical protein ABFD51_00880 [Anaerolineaceae bacterium]
MNKRLVIFVVLLAAMLLSATSAWPATLTVWNYTGDNVYIKLSKYGVMKYFLTATVEGNTDDRNLSRFDIERKTYSAEVTACGTTTTWGALDMRQNLRLTFTPCDSMKQWWTPKYWGEPSQEKPNFYNDGSFEWTPPDWGWYGSGWFKGNDGHAFYFQYDVVD